MSRHLAMVSQRPFFGDHMSRVHGKKCCPYKQNGLPLSQEKVEEFLQQYKYTGDGVQWWRPNEDHTTLTRCYYLNNIFCAVEFVKDVYEMDADTS